MNYTPEINEVHAAFNTAADTLLQTARKIIAETKIVNEKKFKLLNAYGFRQTSEYVDNYVATQQIEFSHKQAELIEYYKNTYPLYKFIQEPQVSELCEKYGLIFGPVQRYTGFVPEKNLIEIDEFKEVKDVDKMWAANEYRYTKIKFSDWKKLDQVQKKHYTLLDKNRLMICAPKKDFDTRGYKVVDYKLEVEPVPDPVVLHTVREGFLIVTAWGDEASDPMVRNEIFN